MKNQNMKYKKQWLEMLEDFGMLKCSKCGYDDCISALDYHHLDPKTKTFSVAHLFLRKPTSERVEKMTKETICLCCRCHREMHAGLWKLPDNPLPKRGIIGTKELPDHSLTRILLSHAIKRIRDKSGLTQSIMSRELGVTTNYLWMLENGLKIPSKRLCQRIAEKFKVPIKGLLHLRIQAITHQIQTK
jgi:DNA-binding XRE family transcriptional regulator